MSCFILGANMLVTDEQLHEMIPGASDRLISKYLSPLNIVMESFHIDTKLRIVAFIAQITHESGSLHYVEELATGTAYEMRKDLGNLEKEALDIAHKAGTTTGRFYKGRGLIQITGFYNYKAAGIALDIDCIHEPTLLCEPLNASKVSAWFWDTHNCNYLADVELFDKITKTINGGYNGKAERDANYQRCKKVLGV